MTTLQQARRAAGFAAGLYAERARTQYAARVRRDPFSRLRTGPGRDDPYPIYAGMRAAGPFTTTRLGNLATPDHAACHEVLRSRRFGVRPEGSVDADDGPGEGADGFDLSFLERNPPDHTRLRRLVAPAFGPRATEAWRPRVEATVTRLLDAVPPGRFDVVSSLAAPLPIAVISDLLGIPDADHAAFTRYGRVIGGALGGITSVRHARALMAANRDLEVIFTRLFELRRREPGDDVVSRLLAVEGEQLRTRELVPLCTLLLIAGFETTVNLVGNAVNALLDHPDQWALLCGDPARHAPSAVTETLRFDAPVQRTVRLSFDDAEVAGHPVRRGQFVHVLLGGANRDPAVFDRPDVFDLTRTDAGEHLAFSSGLHHCVGRPLAELEAAVLLQQLAERRPGLRRAGALRRRDATLIRGPVHLPVTAA